LNSVPGAPYWKIIFAVVLGDPDAFDIRLGRLAVGEEPVVVLPRSAPSQCFSGCRLKSFFASPL
jgi:hypothetical protein